MANDPKWFDDNVYMTNKLAQLKAADADTYGSWDMYALEKAFSDAGFPGEEGAYAHFQQYGNTAAENISPNSNFIAKQYYIFKAADYYDVDVSAVTSAQAAYIADAIEKAGMSAWQHYVQYGTAEGINPSNNFDTNKYLQAKADALNAQGGSTTWTAATVAKAISDAGMNALSHAIQYADGSAGEAAAPFDASGNVIDAYKVDNKAASDDTGSSFSLTREIDNLVGTSGDDTFIGDFATTSSGDQINGAEGTDTVKLYGTNTLPQMTSVEALYLNGTPAGGVDASSLSEIKTVTLDDVVTAGAYTFANGQDVVVSNMGAAEALTLGGNAVTAMNVKLSGDGAKGAGNTTTLNFTGTSLKTLNIETADKASFVTVDNTTGQVVETITVSGDQALNLATANMATAKFKSVDASSATGDVTFTPGQALTANNAGFTYNGGSGKDTVTLQAGDLTTLTAGTQLDGGAGDADTLVINQAAMGAPNYTKLAATTNFEVLGLSGTAFDGTTDSLDVSSIASASFAKHFSMDAAQAYGVTGVLSGTEIDWGTNAAGQNLTITAKAGVHDGLTVNMSSESAAHTTVGTLAAADYTGLTITSNGNDDTAGQITTLTTADGATVKVTGEHALAVNALGGSATVGQTLDASALTGNLTVGVAPDFNATTVVTAGTTIVAAVDTIKGGSGNNTVIVTIDDTAAASKNDVIELKSGSGADKVVFTDANPAAAFMAPANGGSLAEVDNFQLGTDKLYYAGSTGALVDATVGTALTGATVSAKGLVTGPASLADFYTVLGGANAAAGTAYAFVNGGNTYVAIATGATNGYWDVVELAGVQAATGITANADDAGFIVA